MDFNRMINGIIRAIKLDATFYEEVEQDPTYDQESLGVVILASVLGGLGSLISMAMSGQILAAIAAFIVSVILTLIGFFLWVWVTTYVGNRLFKGTGQFDNVKRAMGFAYAPQLLNVLSFIPCLGGIIALVAWVLSVIAGVKAVRQALNQDNTNAILTVVVSAVIVFVILAVLGAILAAIGIGGAAITGALKQ
ncbi:MAG: YIP1 family protein [Anaerolineae bacterium]